MKLLAFDASTEALSVALFDSRTAAPPLEIFEIAPRQHARRLLPAASQLLADSGLELSDLDGLVFARGPGAFTGLRIAAGLVQGLALGAELPVVGVSTLAALAWRVFEREPTAKVAQVVQDARMGEVYTAIFDRDALPDPRTAEHVIAPATLSMVADARYVRAGNGWALIADAAPIDPVFMYPHAGDVARIAATLPDWQGGRYTPAAATPVYVRDDVARKPATGV